MRSVSFEFIREFFALIQDLGEGLFVNHKDVTQAEFDGILVDLKKIMKGKKKYEYESVAKTLIYASALAKKAGGTLSLFKDRDWIWMRIVTPSEDKDVQVKRTFFQLMESKAEQEAAKGTPLAFAYSMKRSQFYITGVKRREPKAAEPTVDLSIA